MQEDVPLARKLALAYEARAGLHEDAETNAYRLFHGYGEGCPRLLIDRLGDVAVIESRGASVEEVSAARSFLEELGVFTSVVLKVRGQEPEALLGTLPSEPSQVRELGLSYWVEPWAPRNAGLYLDARPAREWLKAHSEGRRVLNLYAFAGSLGVAAMAGGAKSVTHVDTQKRALRRCQENHKANGQKADARDCERMDVEKMLRKAAAKKRRFGGIIVDPPPPGVRGQVVSTPVSLAPLLGAVCAEGAWILCFFHHDERSWDELEEAMAEGLGRECEPIWRGRSGGDFPEDSLSTDLRLSALRV